MRSLPNWHPFLVHFPVALFITAVAADASLWIALRRGWLDRTAVLLYAIAAVSSGAAALSGKLAANAMAESLAPDVNEAVAAHGDWAFFAVVMLFIVAAMRFDATWRDRSALRPSLHRMRWLAGLVSVIALAVLVATASRGGELVYRYGVAVQDHGIIPLGR